MNSIAAQGDDDGQVYQIASREQASNHVESLLLCGFGTAAHGMCKELYNHKEHLWTFLSDAIVDPTNNAGERSLRHGVIWRKLSFGTRSERGDRFVETLLTVIESCRLQSRSVLEFVTQALRQTNATN